MTHLLLFLDLTGELQFDVEVMRNILRSISGVKRLHVSEPQYKVFCDFALGDDKTSIYMLNDPRSISIEGIGPASLRIAMEIQKRYPLPLLAIDDGLSFCIPLDEVISLEDFEKKMLSDLGRERLEPR